MSRENVERHYRANEAFSEPNFDALLAVHDPDVEFTPLTLAAEGGVAYRGHDGLRSYWANLHDAFPDFRSEVEEVRDLGDVTFARLRVRAHGDASGAPIDQTAWQVGEWRDGKVIWWQTFATEAEALAAAERRE